nr:putative E3 ubiquitin-protein ligase SINA-like 6 [Setaria viridis]
MDNEPQVILRMSVTLFHGEACLRPLKPPTFKCEAGHRVCGTCRDSHSKDAKLPCAHREFGCESYVVYHEEADHLRACPWAPCSCPDQGCPFFSSPARLLEHLGAHHPWPVTAVSYGKPCKLPVPPPQGWHILVAGEEEEDRRVFLVAASVLGAATAVSVVCVRANGDAAAGAPQFECVLWVEGPVHNRAYTTISSTVRSSNLSRGFAAADQGMFLAVPPQLLHGASGETPVLTVRINRAVLMQQSPALKHHSNTNLVFG